MRMAAQRFRNRRETNPDFNAQSGSIGRYGYNGTPQGILPAMTQMPDKNAQSMAFTQMPDMSEQEFNPGTGAYPNFQARLRV